MICARCGNEAKTATRGEHYCNDCFVDFLAKKIRPQLTFFRVNGRPEERIVPPLLVVAFEYTVPCLALVCMLDEMRKAQELKHGGMAGFRLQCVVHTDHKELPSWPFPHIDVHTISRRPKLELNEVLNANLDESRSSKHDLDAILAREAVLAYTRSCGDAYTAFPYSMTELAEIALAETVKGRGGSVAGLVCPDLQTQKLVYPLREISSSELETFCLIKNLDQHVIAPQPVPKVTKQRSIDEIVHEYFIDVERGFPAVVATVSRVASRLQGSRELCGLCNAENEASTAVLCRACAGIVRAPALQKKLDVVDLYEL